MVPRKSKPARRALATDQDVQPADFGDYCSPLLKVTAFKGVKNLGFLKILKFSDSDREIVIPFFFIDLDCCSTKLWYGPSFQRHTIVNAIMGHMFIISMAVGCKGFNGL